MTPRGWGKKLIIHLLFLGNVYLLQSLELNNRQAHRKALANDSKQDNYSEEQSKNPHVRKKI